MLSRIRSQENPGHFGLSNTGRPWLKQLDHSNDLTHHLWLTKLHKSLKWADAVEKHIQLCCLDKERAYEVKLRNSGNHFTSRYVGGGRLVFRNHRSDKDKPPVSMVVSSRASEMSRTKEFITTTCSHTVWGTRVRQVGHWTYQRFLLNGILCSASRKQDVEQLNYWQLIYFLGTVHSSTWSV